jgi:hypothetical protein
MASLISKISKKNSKLKFIKTPVGYDDKIYNKPVMKIKKNFIKKLEITYNWYMSNQKLLK